MALDTFDGLTLVRAGGFLIALYVFARVVQTIYSDWASPVNILPGPKSTSWLYGNLKDIDEDQFTIDRWHEKYGSTIVNREMFGMKYVSTIDVKATNRILANPSIYGKDDGFKYFLGQVIGEGLLVVENDKHRQQRRVINPAFGPGQIRELTQLFIDKSKRLCDVLAEQVDTEGSVIDILPLLNKTTLDIIGLAGFNYEFDSLSCKKEANELSKSLGKLFAITPFRGLITGIRFVFPIFRVIRLPYDGEVATAQANMNRIGRGLIADSRAAVLREGSAEKANWERKDLLSLLMRSNLATDLPPSLKMADKDVLAQVPTFLVAGHETTATAAVWALFALAQAPDIQSKLRRELLSLPIDSPSMEQLNGLPYLDAVVRESLRLDAPVTSTVRTLNQDDVLPLSKPIVDRHGQVHESIHLKKGTNIRIPILAINRAENVWGSDAKIFRPERWLNSGVPQEARTIPGVWGHMMTFLGGPHSCIGYRFALVELKAILFALIRTFEFELAVPAEDIFRTFFIVQRPNIKSQLEKGNQLPLKVRLAQAVRV